MNKLYDKNIIKRNNDKLMNYSFDKEETKIIMPENKFTIENSIIDNMNTIFIKGEKKCLKGHTKRISSLAYADDYNYLLSGSDDKTLRIWDLKNIEDIQCIKVIKDLMSPIDLLLYLENRLL